VARIKDSSVDAVRAAIDMVELVSAYTPPRKAGARYTARCPFHEERTPSFSINAVDKLYYCFGCGAKGDAITFVREKEGLDFAQAIEWLADRFHVPLEYEEVSPEIDARRRRTERLHALLEQAASFYERYLWDSAAGEPARAYLTGRGFGQEVAQLYRLGLSPSEGRTLAQKAREKGFTDDELSAAGLLNRRRYDYFQGRLMFPLADARGRILGFQARKLREDDPLEAKYVNSPEGDLFRKGAILYGLDRARAAIAKTNGAIIVEGNPDVLALRQAGLEQVVASMGTALTERQLRDLSQLTTHITLCFDGDKAGQDATLRGMDLAVAQKLDVRVVPLPPGVDPADAADSFGELLAKAESYPVYRVRLEVQREPDRKNAADKVSEFLGRVPDSVERQDAAQVAEDLLRVPPGQFAPRALARTGSVSPKLIEAGDRLERGALAGAVIHPGLVPLLAELTPEHFDLELHRHVREYLLAPGQADEELVGLLAELDARAVEDEIDEDTAKEMLLRLRERGIRRELDGCDDPERIKELQGALARLREAVGALS
jgi:DNA primase catalytic core